LVFREALVEHNHPTGGPITMTGNPVKVEGEHFGVNRHAPALGEHTIEFLCELGYTDDEREALRRDSVINCST
jgi:formyl-CoA transferase